MGFRGFFARIVGCVEWNTNPEESAGTDPPTVPQSQPGIDPHVPQPQVGIDPPVPQPQLEIDPPAPEPQLRIRSSNSTPRTPRRRKPVSKQSKLLIYFDLPLQLVQAQRVVGQQECRLFPVTTPPFLMSVGANRLDFPAISSTQLLHTKTNRIGSRLYSPRQEPSSAS